MGGSGGSNSFGSVGRRGGGAGGGSGGGAGGFDCAAYIAVVTLRSPKGPVLAKLIKGNKLRLRLTDGASPVVAEATDSTGRVEEAGSIVVPEQGELIDCIKGGTAYVAEVLSIEGGSCVVDIYAEGE